MVRNNSKNRNSSISAFNQLKESNSKKKKVIWGLSVVALLSVLSTTGLLIFNNTGVSASDKTEETQQIEDLKQSNDELSTLIESMDKNNKELTEKISTLAEEKETLNKNIEVLESSIVTYKANIDNLNNQVINLDSQITTVRAEKVALETQITELEAQGDVDQETIDSLNVQLSTKDSQLSLLTEEKTELEETIILNNAEIEKLENQITEYEVTVENLMLEISALSKGKYQLTLEEPDMHIISADYDYMEYIGDVTSLDGEGNDVPFSVMRSSYSGEYGPKQVIYYNGTNENGAYAIRNVFIESQDLTVKYDGEEISYFTLNAGDTLDFNKFDIGINGKAFKTFSMPDISITNHYTGEQNYLNNDNQTYTLSEEGYYTLTVRVFAEMQGKGIHRWIDDQILIRVGNNPVLEHKSWNDNYKYLNSDFVDGVYTITVTTDEAGEESYTIPITREFLEKARERANQGYETGNIGMSNLPSSILVTGPEGTQYSMVWGGYEWENNTAYMGVDISTQSGQNARFFIDIKTVEDAYESYDSNNSIGIRVSNIEYFENGKGYTDTPQATNIYVEGDYTVIEFDAFERVGNKLYILNNGEAEGYVELDDGDRTTAVWSIVSNTETEVVISIGYALPGTQVYMTIVSE